MYVSSEPVERPTEPSDELLAMQASAGVREAFDQLVERYQRRASSVAYRLLGNMHDALEVCQEAFIRAYRNIESLDQHARFGSWLLRIVTNLALNFRRDRATRRRRVGLEDCLPDDPSELNVSAGRTNDEQCPAARLSAEELRERVRAAIADLPVRQRTALVLYSIEQLPQKVVARIMRCSVEAVKWHVFQARRTLRLRLDRHL